MKRTALVPLLAALLAALCSCTPQTPEDRALHIAATTYPVYLFTTAVTQGAQGVEVELMLRQQTSCLHDYTLTIRDMKLLDRADLVVMNGGGLEDFLPLSQLEVPVIDCSASVELLPLQEEHGHHGHQEEFDPHFWMCRAGARAMVEEIAAGLSALDPEQEDLYTRNCEAALALLEEDLPDTTWDCPYLITFHDGFRYFAQDCGLTLLKAIEEEEGSEASAADLREVLELVRDYRLPAIFVEVNGSRRAAQAIARESGCQVCVLDLVMSGEGTGLQPYLDAMRANYAALEGALGGD